MEKSGKNLLPSDWETLIEDFQSDGARREKWLSQYPGLTILELALYSILKKDFALKSHLIVFVEEFSEVLIDELNAEEGLGSVLEALRSVVQSPIDGAAVTYALKEQMMVAATSIMIASDGLRFAVRKLEGLTELLLTVINRPNHGQDRQTRAIACECLRELESAYPCLLSDIAAHFWNLCQSERTHASQSYILLLTSVVRNLVNSRSNAPILSTSLPLVPFNVPHCLLNSVPASPSPSKEIPVLNHKELRRVTAFLLDQHRILTPCGMMEFVYMLMEVAAALELQASFLKVQFSGLLYSYDPMLCHVVLMLYSRFPDAFDGDESEIARRLMLMSKEVQQNLVFRLIALHWLLGFIGSPMRRDSVKKNKVVVHLVSGFYPTVFDPLALKAVKLDLLAYCVICMDISKLENIAGILNEAEEDIKASVVKPFEDGLVCVSAFKWLPPWSTETNLAFRTLHKFLIGATPHTGGFDDSAIGVLMESTIFSTLQRMLVNMALESRRLVPVIVAFMDRLLGCPSHSWLGEQLLRTFDERLLPKLGTDYQLTSYFPIFDRIAQNDTVPPRGLLELLTMFVVALVEKHDPETGLKSWSQGSKILGVCRTMLMNHHTSRVFLVLSRLLTFTSQFFPDLEIRDNARIYLRMLVCVPGKRLRHILNLGEQLPGISPSPHLSSFFQAQSPRPSRDLKKSRDVSSYIHIERVTPLLVKQSWSLAIPTLSIRNDKFGYFEGIGDSDPPIDLEREAESGSTVPNLSETERISLPQQPLRVMDSKIAEIVGILRRHFAYIPDFRHMPGLKIKIPCTLRFESEPFNRIWGVDLSASCADGVDALPALYATVITFKSTSPYGSIPSSHIPFLLGQPFKSGYDSGQRDQDCLDIVPVENGFGEEESFRAAVMIELEPREPMPGLVDVAIEANAENGQTIFGPLHSITVGIEDMFLKAIIPLDVLEDEVPEYYSELFCALWEVCGNSTNTGRETFPLRGGKGVAAISGTRSVKLLEIPAYSLIESIERHLAPFVVSVIGHTLVGTVRDSGVLRGMVWKDESTDSAHDVAAIIVDSDSGPLQLKYIHDENDADSHFDNSKRNMGCFHVLIFLPPRFHLLFLMEVSDISTLVRIRTDHWPCLAYIDDYLEALFLT